jgi:hypothetical protein
VSDFDRAGGYWISFMTKVVVDQSGYEVRH